MLRACIKSSVVATKAGDINKCIISDGKDLTWFIMFLQSKSFAVYIPGARACFIVFLQSCTALKPYGKITYGVHTTPSDGPGSIFTVDHQAPLRLAQELKRLLRECLSYIALKTLILKSSSTRRYRYGFSVNLLLRLILIILAQYSESTYLRAA